MSKFDRRSFLKTLGLAGGTAAISMIPIKSEAEKLARIMREVNANRAPALHNRPFWVKQVDEITLEMGEMNEEYGRFDTTRSAFQALKEFVGEDELNRLNKLDHENYIKHLQEETPGYSIKDRALRYGARTVYKMANPNESFHSWTAMGSESGREMLNEANASYQAPPEIAARDVKAAAKFYGASLVGVAPLEKRFMNQTPRRNKAPIVFEEADAPYVTEEKFVVPNNFKWAIPFAVRMSPETLSRSPSVLASAATSQGYHQVSTVAGMLAEFIRGLGYEAIPNRNSCSQLVPLAALAGIGEVGRTNRIVTPEFGPSVRLGVVFTDLPMAYDSPIDAGIAEFCKRCKKCAEMCPAGALSFEDEPSWEVQGPWNQPGHKAWFEHAPKCLAYWRENSVSCTHCHIACPWAKKDKAWLHDFVKITSSATPAFDRFFRTMDDAFGYGLKNNEKDQTTWWDLDLPAYGYDTTHGHRRV